MERSKSAVFPTYGLIYQLGDGFPCKEEVAGSNPARSTIKGYRYFIDFHYLAKKSSCQFISLIGAGVNVLNSQNIY